MDVSAFIVTVIVVILIFVIVFFLIKSVIAAALAAIIIAIVFRVFWTYSAEDVIELLKLEQIMTEERVENFKIFYEDYEERRGNDPIFIPEKIDRVVQEEIDEKIDEYLNEIKSDN